MGEEKQEKRQKKKQKQKKTGHAFYAFVVLVLGIVIIVATVILLFHVQTIQVAGNEYVETGEIVECVQTDEYSSNALYVLGKSMMGKITYPKAVESAKITLTAPWSIKITVKEKKTTAYALVGEEYVYFDEEGMVLKKSMLMDDDVPFIENIQAEDAVLYEILPVKEKRLFRNIREALAAFKEYDVKPERIVSDGASLTIYLENVCVELGSGEMELKITQIPPIMEKLDGKTGTLDLKHYNETTEIITFKEDELPKEEEEEAVPDENV